MKKQLLVGLFSFSTALQPLLAEKLITDSPITVNQERLQAKKILGTVLDVTGIPVIGANVMVKGTTNGTITDMDGKFSLEVDNDATLVFSYIGFAD